MIYQVENLNFMIQKCSANHMSLCSDQKMLFYQMFKIEQPTTEGAKGGNFPKQAELELNPFHQGFCNDNPMGANHWHRVSNSSQLLFIALWIKSLITIQSSKMPTILHPFLPRSPQDGRTETVNYKD